MSHRFSSDSSSATRTARRALVGVVLIAIGYLAALLASISVAMLDGSGSALDAGAAPSSLAEKAPQEAVIAPGPASRDFDYFPDQYINHAREIAEQPPTF